MDVLGCWFPSSWDGLGPGTRERRQGRAQETGTGAGDRERRQGRAQETGTGPGDRDRGRRTGYPS